MEELKKIIQEHYEDILQIFQKFYLHLQVFGYAGYYPLVIMDISRRIAAMETLKFEIPSTLQQYIQLIKTIHMLYLYSTDLINIYDRVNLDRDINSSALDREQVGIDLNLCKNKYNLFKAFYNEHAFMNYIETFIEGELTENIILSILDNVDIYEVLPIIKYILKHSMCTTSIKIKMESLKNKLLNVTEEPINNVNTIQNLVTYQNLSPASPILPLTELAEYMKLNNINTIKDLAAIKAKYGFIIICKILPVSVYYNIWQLFRAAKTPIPKTAGVSESLLERYNTVRISKVPTTVKDQILVINRKDENYILQTTDGSNFMLMQEVGSSSLLCTNSSFKPSMRINTYNKIINEEYKKYISTPYVDVQQVFHVDNVSGLKTIMMTHLMQDLKESGEQYIKFFEKYNYENLILLTIENVLQTVPSEHLFPYLNYEFKCIYYYDLHVFKEAMKKGIIDGLSNKLNLNDTIVRGVVDEVMYRLIIKDRKNIFNNLNKKLILLLDLLK